MSDLISRQAAIEIVERYDKSHMALKQRPMLGAAPIVMELEELPSAQPERKKGKWIKLYTGNYKCSECGDWWGNDDNNMIENFHYCPNCGADMRETE